MTNTPSPETPAPAIEVVADEHWVLELGTLLQELESVAAVDGMPPPVVGEGTDNQLIQVRLGAAASLFAALQCKHAATAGHSLRVALSCSAWTLRMGLDEGRRDAVEVAALLHDIGMIGAPDHILTKAGVLDAGEAAVMARARSMSLEILRQSCASQEILDIVEHVGAWYDGNRKGFRFQGGEIPLGARMISITEAFDTMTTDHVFRQAMSHERAMTELFECAGTQFDAELVRQFAEFHQGDSSELHREVATRWLQSLDPELVNSYWKLNRTARPPVRSGIDALFQAKLLDNMYDAVVFINAAMQVTLWNRGAERLTGITGSSIRQCLWEPDLLNLSDEKGQPVSEADCPVTCAIRSGVQSLRRLTICGRTGRSTSVDTHTIPVIAENGTTLGAIMLFHDASSETSLERRCQNLHEKATKDPLTQVANRAEFDRVHEMFVSAHQQQHVPCSLLICDLDRFKQVNDTYGHQAGDEVIKTLAKLLMGSSRPGDLVARYGGEEFVLLCADCDNATATRRAEQIRQTLSQVSQPKMNGQSVTVSFGVTEIQGGDTPETMLRRADRALLMAKSQGRNTVVQLGSGGGADQVEKPGRFWSRKTSHAKQLIERTLVTPVPVKMAIEKLRGFMADHQAKLTKVDDNHVQLEIVEQGGSQLRRLADRPVTFLMDLSLKEERFQGDDGDLPSRGILRTKILLRINPRKNRDRRRDDLDQRGRDVLSSFQSYLMASEEDSSSTGALRRAKQILTPWLANR